MQCWCSWQNSCSIHNYIVPTLCPCCVYTCTVQLYTLTVTVQLSCWPIRESHPSRGHHTSHTHHTPHRQSQMLSSGSPTKKITSYLLEPLWQKTYCIPESFQLLTFYLPEPILKLTTYLSEPLHQLSTYLLEPFKDNWLTVWKNTCFQTFDG